MPSSVSTVNKPNSLANQSSYSPSYTSRTLSGCWDVNACVTTIECSRHGVLYVGRDLRNFARAYHLRTCIVCGGTFRIPCILVVPCPFWVICIQYPWEPDSASCEFYKYKSARYVHEMQAARCSNGYRLGASVVVR